MLNLKPPKSAATIEIDPLQLISSGALLIAADPEAAPKIIENLASRTHLRGRHRRIHAKPKQTPLSTRRRLSGTAAETNLRPPLDRTVTLKITSRSFQVKN